MTNEIKAQYLVQLTTGAGWNEKISDAYFESLEEADHYLNVLLNARYCVKAFKWNGQDWLELDR